MLDMTRLNEGALVEGLPLEGQTVCYPLRIGDRTLGALALQSKDSPNLLPQDLVARLGEAVAARPMTIALAQSHGELHPVIGLWPVALAQDLEEHLRAGVRKVLHWTDRHGVVPVSFPPSRVCGIDIDPFFNANTPLELDQLRAMLAKATKAAP